MDVCWSEKLNMQVICPPRNTDKENNLNDFLVQRNLNIGIQPKQYIQVYSQAVEEYWACWKTITETLIFCRSSPIFVHVQLLPKFLYLQYSHPDIIQTVKDIKEKFSSSSWFIVSLESCLMFLMNSAIHYKQLSSVDFSRLKQTSRDHFKLWIEW